MDRTRTGGRASASDRVGPVLTLLGTLVATSVVAGLIGAGLLMPAVGATGAAARGGVEFFDSLPAELEVSPLAQSSRILAADGSTIATFYDENRILVPLSKISPAMRKAIIAVEDSRFYEHGGVDPKGLVRAFVNNQSGGDTQGASTLTQQYVKLTLQENALALGDEEAAAAAVRKDYARKVQELKYAVTLEQKVPKDRILEGYLNIAYFGDGAYGVEAASRHYFGTNASKLTVAQAALLAGMVQSPNRYDPRSNAPLALARRNVVLDRMLVTGALTQAEYDAAKRSKIALKIRKVGNGCETSPYAFFCDYVYRSLLRDKLLGTPEQARQKIFRTGLIVRTTLNPKIQKATQAAVDKEVPRTDKSKVGAAAVVVEPGTGKVLAMAQNRTFGREKKPGYSQINYSVDRAYGGSSGFQVGSTFKAFTLAAALKKGRALSSTIVAPREGTPFSRDDFKTCDRGYLDASKPYRPYNSEKNESGPMSLTKATADSVNTAFVKLSAEVGLCEVRDTAHDLGVHLAVPDQDGSTDLKPYASLTLGVFDISPLTMAEAYATFASGGIHCDPVAITQVTTVDRKVVAAPRSKCEQALEADIANGVNAALAKVITDGTARGNSIGRPAAGKTGTTNDSRQSWFVGYTPQLTTAVWVGTDPPKPMKRRVVAGEYRRQVYGATIAAPIWKSVMVKASAGLPEVPFGKPSEKVLLGERATVPSVEGMGVRSASQTLRDAGFSVQVGREVSSRASSGTVVYTSPGGGSRARVGSTVTIYPSSGKAPAPQPAPQPRTSTPAPPPPSPPAPAPAPKPKPTKTKGPG